MTDAQETLKTLADFFKSTPNPEYRVLDPVMVKYCENFVFRPEELAKLEPDRDKTDVYLVVGTNTYNYPATVIAETFKKPIVIMGPGTVILMQSPISRRGDWKVIRFLSIFRSSITVPCC